eukprot:887887_1
MDELSEDEIFGINYSCGWKRFCGVGNCNDDAIEDACDACNIDSEQCDNLCAMWSGGQAWLAFNIIGLILCFFGILGIFSDQIRFQCSDALRAKAFILFLISGLCAIIAVIAFVVANDGFNGGCYGDGTNYDLGISNIFDIVIGIVLCLVAFLAFR